jgi:hypothetical protein
MVDIVIQDKVVVDTSKAEIRTRRRTDTCIHVRDTGITGRLDLGWNLAGQKPAHIYTIGDKGFEHGHFFD